MARVVKKEHGKALAKEERGAAMGPLRSTFEEIPRIAERLDELAERWMGWTPFWPLERLQEEVALRVPAVDVFEEGHEVVLKAELPGMKREEIEIHLTGSEVVLSGRKEKSEKVERRDYHRYERSAGSFTRRVALPVEVEIEKATARYADGVLEIRVPKSQQARPAERKVEIS